MIRIAIFRCLQVKHESLIYFKLIIAHFIPLAQWRSVGFWGPGLEVKLTPAFLTFFPENFHNGRPKTNSVIFIFRFQTSKKLFQAGTNLQILSDL